MCDILAWPCLVIVEKQLLLFHMCNRVYRLCNGPKIILMYILCIISQNTAIVEPTPSEKREYMYFLIVREPQEQAFESTQRFPYLAQRDEKGCAVEVRILIFLRLFLHSTRVHLLSDLRP